MRGGRARRRARRRAARGVARCPPDDFFQGYFTTALEPGELLVEVRFPHVGGATGWGFEELARKAGDYAVVAVAAAVTVRDGTIEPARIGLAGVADRPVGPRRPRPRCTASRRPRSRSRPPRPPSRRR